MPWFTFPSDIGPKDCVSRFTLDSATEYLFGRSVDSMSAGLPYPQSSPLVDSPAFLNHPSNTYVRAFVQGQILMLERAALSTKWPLREFWKDRIKPHRDVADQYIEPILEEVLAKKRARKQEDIPQAEEDVTFLSHLVQSTESKLSA